MSNWISVEIGKELVRAQRRSMPASGDPCDLVCRSKGCHRHCDPVGDNIQYGMAGRDHVITFFRCPRCRHVYFLEYEVDYDYDEFIIVNY